MKSFRSALVSVGVVLISAEAFCQTALPGETWTVRTASEASVVTGAVGVVPGRDPRRLFGFSTIWMDMEWRFWNDKEERIYPVVLDYLKPFEGAVFRYPGGYEANYFQWRGAMGPPKDRVVQQAATWHKPASVVFGPDEFRQFVTSVGGEPLFIANLHGKFKAELPVSELMSDISGAMKASRAPKVIAQPNGRAPGQYWELGNELDRAEYTWSSMKYVRRALALQMAIRAVDQQAKFIVPLMEYTPPGQQQLTEFNRQLIRSQLKADAYSMHTYYDGDPVPPVPWMLRAINNAIGLVRSETGKAPIFWITEHGRFPSGDTRKPEWRNNWPQATNMGAALSVADYLIGVAQIPEIDTAIMHALYSGPWRVLDGKKGSHSPNPVYHSLRVLREDVAPLFVQTRTRSPNRSGYGGGYDVRASVFTDQAREKASIWLVNRAAVPTVVSVELTFLPAAQYTMFGRAIRASGGKHPDERDNTADLMDLGERVVDLSATRKFDVSVDPYSVTHFRLVR
jgi:alpha-N-arabinofuranosidase